MKKFIKRILYYLGYEVKKTGINFQNRYLWLQNLNINTVIDVGASNGRWLKFILLILPSVKIFAFEPIKSEFRKVEKFAQKYPAIKCYNFALSNEQGETNFYRSSYSSSSSLLEMDQLHKDAFPYSKEIVVEKVKVNTLDNIVGECNLENNILIKIDVQGNELKVLQGALSTIAKTKIIIIETSFKKLYKGQSFFAEIYSFLTPLGFNYVGNWGAILNPNDGSILQENAIFIKEDIEG